PTLQSAVERAGGLSPLSGLRSPPSPLKRSQLLYERNQGDPEADDEVSGLRRRPVAGRRPAIPPVAVPAAAAEHPRRTLRRALRVLRRMARLVVWVVPVGAPLADVAVHVVQPERVRFVATHLAGAPEMRSLGGASVRVPAVDVRLGGGERVGGATQRER